MKIKRLQINNFKSLVDFELRDLKSFCAFVGPNASGKSNIFEALEFTNYFIRYRREAPAFFGGIQTIYSFNPKKFDLGQVRAANNLLTFSYEFDDNIIIKVQGLFHDAENEHFSGLSGGGRSISEFSLSPFDIRDIEKRGSFVNKWKESGVPYDGEYEQFVDNFSRIFVGKSFLNRGPQSIGRLTGDASNLAQMLGTILENKERKEDFVEWLRILIPEFQNIEIKKSNINGEYDFFIYEKGTDKPFPRNLISDGTYNILSLMAAVYQNTQPQFLCIEEPENGLHPQAIELLVDFFREKCEEEGHHIWLNTHSQTLVRSLEIEEIILVNKINGQTQAKQLRKEDEVDIKTDEAWLTNALGGGVLWSK